MKVLGFDSSSGTVAFRYVYYASTILPVTLWQIKTSHLLWQV